MKRAAAPAPTGPRADAAPTPFLLALGRGIVRWRVLVLAAVLGVTAAIALGLPHLRVGFAVSGFFRSGGDPELAAALAHYSDPGFAPPDHLLAFAWPEAEPTGSAAFVRLQRFEQVCRQSPLVRKVLSLASATVPGRLRSTPEDILTSATWRDLLVGKDGRSVGGIVVLDRSDDVDGMAALFASLHAAMQETGVELRLCGLPHHRVTTRDLVQRDLAWFLPIGTAISAVFLFWLVPNVLLALQALLVVPLVLAATFGTMALAGVSMTMLTSTLPTLLLCMSVADGVHMVGRFLEERHRGHGPCDAAAHTFAALFVPCFLTSLTTCVGFLTLCTAELADLRHLGAFAAIGMAFAFVFTVTVLPATMSWVGGRAGLRPVDPATLLMRLARRSLAAPPRLVAVGAALLMLGAALAGTRLRADHHMTGDLWPDSPPMQQLRFYERNFVGIVPAEIVVTSEHGFGGAAGERLAELCAFLERDPGVSRTLSLVDLQRDGLSLPLVHGLAVAGLLPAGLLSRDGRTARVLAFRGDLGTHEWRRFSATVREFAASLPGVQVRLAGIGAVGSAQVERMTVDLMQSFFGSIAVICVLMWIACRSLRLSLIAVATCLLPLCCVLGGMALLDAPLRPLTMIAFCVAFGLMVDDAIHLIARWQEERRAGRAAYAAVVATLVTAGRPVCVTTVLLLVGFVVILGSEFRGTWSFGALVTGSLSLSLLAALVLLPALLRLSVGRDRAGDGILPR